MQLFSSLLFGLAASLDAFPVGITYGIRNVRIHFQQNLIISLITLLSTCLSVFFGSRLLPLLPSSIGRVLGSCILIFLGIYYLLKFMIITMKKCLKEKSSCNIINTEKEASAKISEQPPSIFFTEGSMTAAQTCLLGVTLSINNIGIGLSASMAGLLLLPTCTVTFLFSIIFLMAGNRLGGCRLLQFTKKAADPISGLLLIILGICQLRFG